MSLSKIDLTDAEVAVLKRLLYIGPGEVAEPEMTSLRASGFIRTDQLGWAISFAGHSRYLRELPKQFREPEEPTAA